MDEFWKNRGGKEWIEDCWNSQDNPHRQQILEAISSTISFHKIDSILEVGCGCAPNLALIQKKFPHLKLAGIDINKNAIEFGKQKLPNVDLSVGDIYDLPFAGRTFDIVLTDAVLLYVSPEKIELAIDEMKRVATNCLILSEWHHKDTLSFKSLGTTNSWARDYTKFLNKSTLTKIKGWEDGNWKEYGYIVKGF